MFVDALPGRSTPSWLLTLIGWLSLAGLVQAAEPMDGQRMAFKQAYASAQQGGDAWRTLATSLHDYPLYPYLQAASLEHDIAQLAPATVTTYLQQYPSWIPAEDLRRNFLLELARRQDWNSFLAMYQPGLGEALTCDALQARLARGETLDFTRDLSGLWATPSLPAACDSVLSVAHQQGLLTSTRLWTRIDLAIDAGQAATVAKLAPWLPDEDRNTAQQLALAMRDPAATLAAASTWPDSERYRRAATLALVKLARRQSASADTAWQNLRSRFAFDESQRDQVLRALALYHATDFDAQALQRLVALPVSAQSDATREWRARIALAEQNWQAVLDAIGAMTETQKQDGEWRYFQARALSGLGRDDEAHTLLSALASEPTFFGFLAADRLKQTYAICPLELAADPQREQALLDKPGLQRAFELYAVNLPKLARREWSRALQDADPGSLQLATQLANQRGWYDRAAFTLNHGDMLRLYTLRFPLAPEDAVVAQAKQAGIDPAWAYGILRAESAWVSDARSGADARGLMQLVPDTAAQVARRNDLTWGGGDTLYDPAVNIQLGTRYLAELAARYEGTPWLASAAYDAGPNKLDQWLQARGNLSPDLFVATIPYKETREYVARVMAFSVIYDWRINGRTVALAERMTPNGQPYRLPDATTVREDVACPAPRLPATHSTMPSPATSTSSVSP